MGAQDMDLIKVYDRLLLFSFSIGSRFFKLRYFAISFPFLMGMTLIGPISR